MPKKLFVGGLNCSTSQDALQQIFSRFGSITEIKLITDRDTGKSRGFAFITFAEAKDAHSAMAQMRGTEVDGRIIRINEAEERNVRAGPRVRSTGFGRVPRPTSTTSGRCGSGAPLRY